MESGWNERFSSLFLLSWSAGAGGDGASPYCVAASAQRVWRQSSDDALESLMWEGMA